MSKVIGFQGKEKDVIKMWNKYSKNWKTRRSPWRPSCGDLVIYKKLLGRKNKRILLLGATPEIRNIIGKNMSTVLADMCPNMIKSMSKSVLPSKIQNEMYIITNWCKMPFLDSSFDVVLSDCPWWILSIEDQKKVSTEILRILKPDGEVICRLHYCNELLTKKKLGDIIEEHCLFNINDKESLEISKETLMLRLLDATTNKKNQRFVTSEAIKAVKKKISEDTTKNDQMKKNFLINLLKSIEGRSNLTSQTKEQIYKILKTKFIIEHETHSKDYSDSTYFPIIKMRRATTHKI